jgi:hypothetical protein
MAASPINSSKRSPCPICGRTKDGDCRQMPNGTILCHKNTDHKKGSTITVDGTVYAFVCESSDGRGGVFKVDEPLAKRPHLRVVASGGTAIKPSVPAPLPALPSPTTFFIARFTPQMEEKASWQEGEFWHYNADHRQQRQTTSSGKTIYVHHRTAEGWKRGGGKGCPCWNEQCLPLSDGTAIYGEGEKVAAALCELGVLGMSIPGHEAESIEKCTTALARHKELGVELVAYVADNDKAGKKKAAVMASAAAAAGLPFISVNAGNLWPDLPQGGSIDDLVHLGEEVVAVLDQGFRDELQRVTAITDRPPFVADKPLIDPIEAETTEKQDALHHLVDELVEAQVKGNEVRVAALISQTWRLGIPSTTTETLVLKRWASSRGIELEESALQETEGRTIGGNVSLEAQQQRLPGFLLEHGLHLMVADAGVGKSTMALAMALRLSTGGSFLDQQEGVSSTGKVLYIGTDGGSTAFSMLSDYATDMAEPSRWGGVEFWCEEPGKRKPWVLTLPNLERLANELAKGEITAVFIDTINAVFQGAGISPYTGPVDQYLRLLKAIVCPYGPLVMLGHTNRSGSGIKGIGGSPAFQEVPDALHLLERKKEPEADGTLVFRWTVQKLRGEPFRQFSYAKRDDGFQLVDDSHFFTACGDKLLVAIDQRRLLQQTASVKDLIVTTKEAPSSVRAALTRLRQRGLVEKKGTGFLLTDKGKAKLATLKA